MIHAWTVMSRDHQVNKSSSEGLISPPSSYPTYPFRALVHFSLSPLSVDSVSSLLLQPLRRRRRTPPPRRRPSSPHGTGHDPEQQPGPTVPSHTSTPAAAHAPILFPLRRARGLQQSSEARRRGIRICGRSSGGSGEVFCR